MIPIGLQNPRLQVRRYHNITHTQAVVAVDANFGLSFSLGLEALRGLQCKLLFCHAPATLKTRPLGLTSARGLFLSLFAQLSLLCSHPPIRAQ